MGVTTNRIQKANFPDPNFRPLTFDAISPLHRGPIEQHFQSQKISLPNGGYAEADSNSSYSGRVILHAEASNSLYLLCNKDGQQQLVHIPEKLHGLPVDFISKKVRDAQARVSNGRSGDISITTIRVNQNRENISHTR